MRTLPGVLIRLQQVAAGIGAAPGIIVPMGQSIPLHDGHLGAAVGQNDQLWLSLRESLIHQCFKGGATAVTEFRLALPVGAGGLAVGIDPVSIGRVIRQLREVFSLKDAKAHLPQVG